jgi:hypothetical protein
MFGICLLRTRESEASNRRDAVVLITAQASMNRYLKESGTEHAHMKLSYQHDRLQGCN